MGWRKQRIIPWMFRAAEDARLCGGLRGPACGHSALNSTRRFSWRAALVDSGEDQELWPSSLRDDPQIILFLRDLPALPGHSFELPIPASHHDPQ